MDIYKLFELVTKEKASDLLISAGAPPILRVNGELFRTRTEPLTPEQSKALIYSFLSEAQYNAFEVNRELDISLAVEGKHRFRVNVYMQKGNVSAALRPIPEAVPSVIELGLPEIVTSLSRARQGLILVTGPTGSGKTTTQAALVDLINSQRACHIITVEDPIEYIHHHRRSIVDQREVGGDTDSFSSALKYVLRQDPDVILIGEMRDLETIQAALTAAETGHLVLATLHTNDAIQTIDRVVDVFPPQQQQQVRFQFSMALLAILSQRLIPHRTKKKRVLACEVLRNNSAIANLIREQKSHQVYSVVETAAKEGMITMDRAVKDLYAEGRISFDDAVSLMRHPKELERMGA
ncbi:MAG: PilT/PilU family type 4a pilus ATPase [Candidatus Hydrogenedens sp.]|nr:PilT/PilU family type 4a pilus ATPase [Candidatus Hydrogenedentota bacterium]NLF56378.1 PilT/PilU family type 4a pilus ATPase [Candidatus Hydrogenedens sp.]